MTLHPTKRMMIENIDQVIAEATRKALKLVAEKEDEFIESVTARGAMSEMQARDVLDEERPGVLESIDDGMKTLRAWILRGCTDFH